MSYCYEYPRPALTADVAVFGLGESSLSVLLIQRDQEPFAGQWALPGGFVEIDETSVAAAKRELSEETGLSDLPVRFAGFFDDVQRDPRGRIVTAAYYSLIPVDAQPTEAGSDARQTRWFPTDALPPLAFDHAEILATANRCVCQRLVWELADWPVLPEQFTAHRLKKIIERVTNRRAPAGLVSKMCREGILVAVHPTDSGARGIRYRFQPSNAAQPPGNRLLLPW